MNSKVLKRGNFAKGFKFNDGIDNTQWLHHKEQFIGKVGKVSEVGESKFEIDFDGELVYYPISLMHLAFIADMPVGTNKSVFERIVTESKTK